MTREEVPEKLKTMALQDGKVDDSEISGIQIENPILNMNADFLKKI